jgi:predicted TPR repeat methyltransferase
MYDVVVVGEVLYYVGDLSAVSAAVNNIINVIRPGGLLLFSSATDRVVKRWGYEMGAESTLRLFGKHLTVRRYERLRGDTADDEAVVASLLRPT